MVARSSLTIEQHPLCDSSGLVVSGVLDGTTYLTLRNAIVKAALDEPRAVVIDVSALSVPAPSAWAVFTSARWLVSVWPDVPVLLVGETALQRDEIRRAGITRYVPVFGMMSQALESLPAAAGHYRRRARAELLAIPASVPVARLLVKDWLTKWSQEDLASAAAVVTTVLMENAVCHGGDAAVLRAESDGNTLTIAVEDDDPAGLTRHESVSHAGGVTGLEFVNVLCHHWGQLPTGAGKAVWAVIGPDGRL